MPFITSSFARPRMSKIFGGCTSVSIVSATSGLCLSEGSFGAFFGVDDELRAVPGECDLDVAGGAGLGDVGHAEQVASQELLADREVQDRGDLVWLHGGRSFVGVIEAGSAAPTPGTEPPERSRHLRSTNLRIRTSGAHSRPDWSSTSCMCMFLGSVALFASDRRGDMSFAWHRPSRGAGGHHHSSRLSLH